MQAIVVTITTFPESADTSKTIFLAFSLGLKYGIQLPNMEAKCIVALTIKLLGVYYPPYSAPMIHHRQARVYSERCAQFHVNQNFKSTLYMLIWLTDMLTFCRITHIISLIPLFRLMVVF